MDTDEFIAIVAVFALIVVPALGLTARFALKPIVEALIVLRDGLIGRRLPDDVERRLAAIEAELTELGGAVRRLSDVQRYDRELAAGSAKQDASGS